MELLQYVALISGCIATVLNVCLLPIILVFSSKKLSNYKYFLLTYTLNATIYSMAQVVSLGTFYVFKDGSFFYATNHFMPRYIQLVAVLLYIGAFLANLLIIAWCFFYRLSTMNNFDYFRHKWKIRFGLVLSFLIWFLLMLSTVPLLPNDKIDAEFDQALFNISNVALKEVVYVGGPFFVDESLNPSMLLLLTSYVSYSLLMAFLITLFWLRIHRRLQDIQKMNLEKFKLQYRVYILLSLQTICPVVFNATPVFIVALLGLLQIEIGKSILLCGAVLSFAQILDPIFTVVLISDYKSAIQRVICGYTTLFHAYTDPISHTTSSQLKNSATSRV